MTNFICWICGENRPYAEYEETKLLDDNGDKPCLECITEDGSDEYDQESAAQ